MRCVDDLFVAHGFVSVRGDPRLGSSYVTGRHPGRNVYTPAVYTIPAGRRHPPQIDRLAADRHRPRPRCIHWLRACIQYRPAGRTDRSISRSQNRLPTRA